MDPKDDRIFVRDGRRHHRRTYSAGELRAGAVVLVVLASLLGWVVWKGAHPDPALFALEVAAQAGATGAVGSGGAPPGSGGGSPGSGASPAASPHGPGAPAAGVASPTAAGRGPLPVDLAPPGFVEGRVSDFDAENLYVKVDGRADFYIGFGFRHLWVVTLAAAADPSRTIDVELYDQGSSANALGTWQGERSPQAPAATLGTEGVSHLDRNALFLTRGRHYVRAIGANEDAAMREALVALRERLERGLPGEPLPWSFGLFAGRLGMAPGDISYQAENAFSFAFAREVHVARPGSGDTELFVVRAADPAAARALALQFSAGFRDLGEDAGTDARGVAWSKDRYLGSVSGAKPAGSFVAGVRGAPDRTAAEAALGKLSAALATLVLPEATSVPPRAPDAARASPPPAGAAYAGGQEGGH